MQILLSLANGEISAISQRPASFKYVRGDYKDTSESADVRDHRHGIAHVLNAPTRNTSTSSRRTPSSMPAIELSRAEGPRKTS
jgi:hypothetical protein